MENNFIPMYKDMIESIRLDKNVSEGNIHITEKYNSEDVNLVAIMAMTSMVNICSMVLSNIMLEKHQN